MVIETNRSSEWKIDKNKFNYKVNEFIIRATHFSFDNTETSQNFDLKPAYPRFLVPRK
jgi:hypothetical protein